MALVLGLVAGCSGDDDASPPEDVGSDDQLPPARIDVDTAQLREIKQDAGIDPCPESDASAKPVDGGLPETTLPCLGGGRDVDLHGLRGTPMVINLWATWCGPCRDELPVLQEFYERARGEVLLLGVNFEDPQPEGALRLLEELGVRFPQIADFDKEIDRAVGRHPMPTTVLVDEDGMIVKTLPQVVDSADELADEVSTELGVQL